MGRRRRRGSDWCKDDGKRSVFIYDVFWWCSCKIAVRGHALDGQLGEVGGNGVSAVEGHKGSEEILGFQWVG